MAALPLQSTTGASPLACCIRFIPLSDTFSTNNVAAVFHALIADTGTHSPDQKLNFRLISSAKRTTLVVLPAAYKPGIG